MAQDAHVIPDLVAQVTGPAVLQSKLASAPWDVAQTAGLPGTRPCTPETWLTVDDAYAGQMALRSALIRGARASVIGVTDRAEEPLEELYGTVLAALAERADFDVTNTDVGRPDGTRVPLERSDPLGTLGHLVAEDLCILQRLPSVEEHALTAAVLCFPAHWSLDEKLGRPMGRIHKPSAEFDENVRRRVQRMFDGLRPGVMLMRMNCHPSPAPDIFTPQREADPTAHSDPNGPYLRSERQCLRKLPRTGAIVFSIQTRMVARANLTGEQVAGYATWRAGLGLA